MDATLVGETFLGHGIFSSAAYGYETNLNWEPLLERNDFETWPLDGNDS